NFIFRFCTGAEDGSIRLFTYGPSGTGEGQELGGHRFFVNAVAFEPTEGQQLASVGDDRTCRIWTLDGVSKACFPLKFSGISVCWLSNDPDKILVAEKAGVVRLYSLVDGQPLLSLESEGATLASADWSGVANHYVGAAAGAEWLIWDLNVSSLPRQRKHAHVDGAHQFKWSRVCEGLFATTGCVGKLRGTLSIHNLAHDQACVPFAFNQCLAPVKSTKKGILTPETRPSRPLQLGPSQVCHVPVIQHNMSLPKKKRLGCTCMSQNKTEGPNIVEKRVWDEESGKSLRTVVCLILFTNNNSFYQLGVNWGMLTAM
uniref:Uncharacterized protein n=1 Tax=Eptatretus burgeri TaxID=7764 RepID=A0A8C4QED3_EPTBU